MSEPSPQPPASQHPAVYIATLVSVGAAMLTILGALVGMGVWKGGVDEKVIGFDKRLDKQEQRLTVVETEAQTAVQNSQFIIKSLEEFRGETKARFDRQMDRLDKMSDQKQAHPAP